MMKRIIVLFCLLFSGITAFSSTYSVAVGKQLTIKCSASAPEGYVTHAFFMLKNNSDSKYLAIQSVSQDRYAIVTGLSPCANIPVDVIFSYSYTGAYDHKTHVGQGSYTEYVTVVGGPAATNISITPKDPIIKVGETISITLSLTPSNASSAYEWGVISSFGQPFKFDYVFNGNTAIITAKSEGQLYLCAQTSNEKYDVCCITATQSESDTHQVPEGIDLSSSSIFIPEQETYKLSCVFYPAGSSSKVTWTSSNINVATVSDNGTVKGIASGKATITATTDNNLTATATVQVYSTPVGISIQEQGPIYLGYTYKLTPSFTPENSFAKCGWSTSDSSIATVTNDGIVKPLKAGKVIITAKTANSLSSSVELTVSEDAKVDYRNVSDKINLIKSLINESILK